MLIITFIIILIDQIVKNFMMDIDMEIVQGIFNLTYVENRGMIFGMWQGSNAVMVVLSVIICFFVCIYAMKGNSINNLERVSLYIVLGGRSK